MNFTWLPKHLEKYLIIVIAIIVLILDIFSITSTSVIYEAVLAIFAILVFFLIKLENKLDNIKIREDLFIIDKFNQNRSDLPSFDTSLLKAEKEIIIWAACLGSTILKLGTIKNHLKKRKKIKILLMALENESESENPLISYVSNFTKDKGFVERLKISHNVLKEFYTSLDKKTQQLLEIRTYLNFPTSTYLLLDKDNKNGIIRVEPNLYGLQSDEMPSFEVKASSNSSLYNVLLRSFIDAWENAKSLI